MCHPPRATLMNRISTWLVLGASIAAWPQQSPSTPRLDADVVLTAVSRDDGVLVGGIGLRRKLGPGKLIIEPLAKLDSSGSWRGFDCDGNHQDGCRKFEKEYLSKHHTYTVVSADGRGATVNAAPIRLDECFDYTGKGTYSGASIGGTAIAASSTEMFTTGSSARLLTDHEFAPIRKELSALIPSKFDSARELRIYSVYLEGQSFFVIQRAFQDYGYKPGYETVRLRLIFAIGAMHQGRFHLLQWKKNVDDENELVLGTIHLTNGRDFLITTVSDPESQSFRIYGISAGRLIVVYSGGGGSC
jgi:hypothetical protein